MINIILIECAYHDELIGPCLEVFNTISSVSGVTLYTTKDILARSGADVTEQKKAKVIASDLALNRPDKNIDYISYLFKRQILLNNILNNIYISIERRQKTLIIILTIAKSMLSIKAVKMLKKLRSKKDCQIFIGIHNSYEWFEIEHEDSKRIKSYEKATGTSHVVRWLDALTKTGRKQLLGFIDGFYVISPRISIPTKKPIIWIPPRLSNKELFDKRKNILADPRFFDKCRIVIPGTVDEGRRDYLSIFDRLEDISIKQKNLEIILLGKMKAQVIRAIINKGKFSNMVKAFDGYIDKEKYQNEILNSHFVLLNLRYVPPYGKYKISGPEIDAASLGIPMIVPQNYIRGGDLHSGVAVEVKNIGDSIEVALDYFNDRKKYMRLAEQALENSKLFRNEQVSAQILSVLSSQVISR